MNLIIETRSLDSVLLFVVQSLSHVWLSEIPWTAAHQASLSIAKSWSLLKLMSIESMTSSKHLILGCPFLLLPSIFSSIKVFSNELALCISRGQSIRASVSASVLPMNIQDWFPLGLTGSPCSPSNSQESSPAPQLKASILWHSVFFIVQLSHSYMTTGKTIALARQTFVSKLMSLLFNMLSMFVTSPINMLCMTDT